MVVFDVTQMSYQSSDRVYRAQMVSKVINRVYRAQKVSIAVDSVYRACKVNKGKSVFTELTRSSKEKSVFTELTRSSKERRRNQFLPSSLDHHRERSVYRVHSATKGFNGILCINRAQSVNTRIIFCVVFTELSRSAKDFSKVK